MDKDDLIQTAFLGFLIAVFFKLFDFLIFNHPLYLNQYNHPYPQFIFFYQFSILLFLVTFILFILGYKPNIINLKDYELINFFKKAGWYCFIIFFLFFLFLWISGAYLQ